MFDKKRYSLGIDIGSNHIKIVLLSYTEKDIFLEKYIIQRTPMQLLQNGSIVYPEEMGAIIKSILIENGIKTKKASVSVPVGDETAILKIIDVPNLKKKEMGKAILSMIEDELLNPVDKLYYNWQLINTKKINGQDLAEVLLIGSPKTCIDALVSTLKTSNIKPYYAEADIFSILRVMGSAKGENIALVDIGHKQTKIGIISNDVLSYPRVIPNGGDDFITSISENYGVDYKTAENILHNDGALCTNQYPYSNSEDLTIEEKKCSKVLTNSIDKIIDEITTTLEFCYEYSKIAVDKIILVGGSAKIKGITNYFNANLNYKTEVISPNILISEDIQNKEEVISLLPSITCAIGLALREVYDNV